MGGQEKLTGAATLQRTRTLASSVGRRLLAVLLVAVVAGMAAFYWVYKSTTQAAQRREMGTTLQYFRIRLEEIDNGWRLSAINLRTQIAHTRILDDAKDAQLRLTAYLSSLADGMPFSHVLLIDETGQILLRFQPGGQPTPDIGLPQALETGWLFSAADATLYRALVMPTLTQGRGGHRLVMLAALDNALLSGTVFPGVHAYLLWQDKVLASSRGNEPVGLPVAALAPKGDDQLNAEAIWNTDAGAPRLLLQHDFRNPVALREAMLPFVFAGVLLAILGWLVLGSWLSRLALRLDGLRRASSMFSAIDRAQAQAAIAELKSGLDASQRQDEIHGVAAALHDSISARLETEVALRESEALFSSLFHDAPVPLMLAGESDGVILDVNNAWLDLFGFGLSDVVGRSVGELALYAPDDAGDDGGRGGKVERSMVGQNGRLRICQQSTRPMSVKGNRAVLTGIVDVTDQRHAQQQVEELNKTLEGRVAERTADLSKALDTLKHAQEEIIRGEKLAALGALVAGVAHELNTPIGNGMLMATSLHDRISDALQSMGAGTLRRSELERMLHDGLEASGVVVRNLERAGSLVTSFKQVAVDQTTEHRRTFNLARTVSEIISTLSPTLRKTPYLLEAAVDDTIQMDSFPGHLAQIITNLINNAILHAFDGRQAGLMRLSARSIGSDQVEILFEDDGCGIAPENQKRIFDPFFTTKFGQGGSGLGLHIIFNLATGVLGGDIKVASEVGHGTRFTLTLPRSAPGRPRPG